MVWAEDWQFTHSSAVAANLWTWWQTYGVRPAIHFDETDLNGNHHQGLFAFYGYASHPGAIWYNEDDNGDTIYEEGNMILHPDYLHPVNGPQYAGVIYFDINFDPDYVYDPDQWWIPDPRTRGAINMSNYLMVPDPLGSGRWFPLIPHLTFNAHMCKVYFNTIDSSNTDYAYYGGGGNNGGGCDPS